MADHAWIIPVSAGVSSDVVIPPLEGQDPFLNVQWSTGAYPGTAGAARVIPQFHSVFVGQSGTPNPNAGTLLSQCHASWNWSSCGCDGQMTLGAQLLVGTVFGADFCDADYTQVQVAAKYRVPVPARLSYSEISINDASGAAARTAFTPPNGNWNIVCSNAEELDEFADRNNLRVLLTFLGTLSPANAGVTFVDVEWFMIHLF